jgi:hypothetical protein
MSWADSGPVMTAVVRWDPVVRGPDVAPMWLPDPAREASASSALVHEPSKEDSCVLWHTGGQATMLNRIRSALARIWRPRGRRTKQHEFYDQHEARKVQDQRESGKGFGGSPEGF